MRQNRDFHRLCRVVYRAMRKKYGTEKVQDECLRVFKVVFPFLHKARTEGADGFDETAKRRVREIFESWNVEKDSRLDTLLDSILKRMDEPFTKEELIIFCEDILVVVMRIRKLTPRECGRLMDVSEKDLDVMLSCGISKSALYKLFGNSIVESCLYNIFRTLFIDKEQPKVAGTQLSLF